MSSPHLRIRNALASLFAAASLVQTTNPVAPGAQSPNEGLEAASHMILMVSADVAGALEFRGGIIFGRETTADDPVGGP